jgi:hypothetical protein
VVKGAIAARHLTLGLNGVQVLFEISTTLMQNPLELAKLFLGNRVQRIQNTDLYEKETVGGGFCLLCIDTFDPTY